MKRYLLLICLGTLILASCGSVSQDLPKETSASSEVTTPVTTILSAEETAVSSLLPVTDTSELRSGTVTAAEITEQETTTEETEIIPKPVPLSKMSTSEGIELDPNSEPVDPEKALDYKEGKGKSFLLKRFDDHTAIYGVFSNEERVNDYGDSFPVEKVAIQHDGVIDEIECDWTGRWVEPAHTVELADIDNDGEDEIIMINYVIGGTMCCVYDLTIFDKSGENFIKHCAWYDDNYKIFSESFSYDIDTSKKKAMVYTDSGTYYLDYSDSMERYEGVDMGELAELVALDLIEFEVRDGRVIGKFTAGGITSYGIEQNATMPVIYPEFTFDVTLAGNDIIFDNYRLEGYDYILKKNRKDNYNVEYTLSAHDHKTDKYIEITSGVAYLPEDLTDPDRYADLSICETEIMGQKCVRFSHVDVQVLTSYDYYTVIDGKPIRLAENFGNNLYVDFNGNEYDTDEIWKYPKTIEYYDFDNDGQCEFISENMYPDCMHNVEIYRFEDGRSYVASLWDKYGSDAGLQGTPDITIRKQDNGKYLPTEDYILEVGQHIDENGNNVPAQEVRLGDLTIDELPFKEVLLYN